MGRILSGPLLPSFYSSAAAAQQLAQAHPIFFPFSSPCMVQRPNAAHNGLFSLFWLWPTVRCTQPNSQPSSIATTRHSARGHRAVLSTPNRRVAWTGCPRRHRCAPHRPRLRVTQSCRCYGPYAQDIAASSPPFSRLCSAGEWELYPNVTKSSFGRIQTEAATNLIWEKNPTHAWPTSGGVLHP
jgi:hypothetical protein